MPLPPIPGWSAERLEAHLSLVFDSTGTVIYGSHAFLRFTGLPFDRVFGASAAGDPAMARAFKRGLEFLLSGGMARLGMTSGEIQLPARPGPTLRCRFEYQGVPAGDPEYHVFVYEPIEEGSDPSQRRILRMEGALYEIQLIVDRVGLPGPHREMPEPVELASLTERELDVVKLLLDGNSNEAIARLLHVSLHTVKSHAQAIFRKLGVHSRAELLARFVSGLRSGAAAK